MPISKRRTSSCPKGTIRRKSYNYRRNGKTINVKSTCIKDIGKKGKGKKLFTLKKGELGLFGYRNVSTLSIRQRHIALNKAEKKLGTLSLFRKLNALYVVNKNKNKKLASIFLQDRDWVRRNLNGT